MLRYNSKEFPLLRIVDLALNQAAKPWSHQYLDPAWYYRSGGQFPIDCIGDKSATLLLNHHVSRDQPVKVRQK